MMIRRRTIFAVLGAVALASAALPQIASAQEDEPARPRMGVGFQSSWPSYGVSGILDLNKQMSAQAVLGFFGTVSTLSGRGIYRFMFDDLYNVFGFGTAGVWRYSAGSFDESVLGVGGGAGVELDWADIIAADDDDFPPIFSTIEIGLILANFDNYNLSALSIGGGIHYHF